MSVQQLRLLLDENIPSGLAARLSHCGHDCLHMGLVDPGATDVAVVAHAARLHRILLTLDRGLPVQAKPPFPPAILVCDAAGLQDLPTILSDLPVRDGGTLLIYRNGVLRQGALVRLLDRQRE